MPGVTLIGEGANPAVLDGAGLGKAFAEHPDDTETALADYERAMFPRGAASAADGAVPREQMLGQQSPRSLLAGICAQG